MGMPISIDIPTCNSDKIFKALFDICANTDERFSPYKKTSEICKLWNGSVKQQYISQDMKHIMAECAKYEKLTNGYFSAHFSGKQFNPTGYVKAWCLQRMDDYLASQNIGTYLLNAGGDIVARSSGGHTWDIAIANPFNTAKPIANMNVDNLCIATSGSYEKGTHIIDPHTGKPASDLASVTVFGPSIETADVFATAVYAMGEDVGLEFIKTQPNYEAIFIHQDGTLAKTTK